MIRLFPPIALLLILLPVLGGLVGTLLPAFGYLPSLGGTNLSFDPFRATLAQPGFAVSFGISAFIGLTSTVLAVGLVLLGCAMWFQTRWFSTLIRAFVPVVAVPHAALALGLAFLIAPSGWIVRSLSPWATGWDLPPDLATVNDPLGVAMVVGLVIKESAYLLMMTAAALGQLPVHRTLAVARTLGHGPIRAFFRAVVPQLYPLIRLPIYAVLVYGLSSADMALILGPTAPPTLSILILQGFADPDLSMRFSAAAGAVLQITMVVGCLLLWRGMEHVIWWLSRRWEGRDPRSSGPTQWNRARHSAARGLLPGILAVAGLSLLAMALWSITRRWSWPDALPSVYSLSNWQVHLPGLVDPLLNTILAAGLSVIPALIVTLGCLEQERRNRRTPGRWVQWVIYTPLLVPQIGFLFGVQVLFVQFHMDGTLAALVLAHILFVLPYMFLALADPYRRLDPRYGRTAQCLGAGPNRQFFAVVLPMMVRPLLFAVAVGIAVSVGQYLPTVFAGAGRLPTLTTEAVGLAAGSDRRIIGVYAVLQSLIPLLAFYVAALWKERSTR